jgi:hypothetical protein
MDVAAEPFLQLLRTHKDTLKHLNLGCLSLFGDSYDDAGPGWKYVFEQAQEVLNLETASVVELTGWGGCRTDVGLQARGPRGAGKKGEVGKVSCARWRMAGIAVVIRIRWELELVLWPGIPGRGLVVVIS